MKKKIMILFVLFTFYFFCCQSSIRKEEYLVDVSRCFSIIDDSNGLLFYHLFFENKGNKNNSFGINIFDLSSDVTVSLFPGSYNMFGYGMVEKTSTSQKVYSFSICKNLDFFDQSKELTYLNFVFLAPYAIVEHSGDIDNIVLKVYMEQIADVFSLSSVSVKQGSDRVRSLDFCYDSVECIATAQVPFFENGDWYMNISYALKSKIDSDVIDADGMYISTSYFKNIYLGDFIF